jgi:hypothetical protein
MLTVQIADGTVAAVISAAAPEEAFTPHLTVSHTYLFSATATQLPALMQTSKP